MSSSAPIAVGLGLGLALAGACSSATLAPPGPVCRTLQFRACRATCGDGGRGVQQCAPSGQRWGRCYCAVLDASFDVPGPEAHAEVDVVENRSDASDAPLGDQGGSTDRDAQTADRGTER